MPHGDVMSFIARNPNRNLFPLVSDVDIVGALPVLISVFAAH